MIDRNALAREMEADILFAGYNPYRLAKIALRHITAARAEALRDAISLCDGIGAILAAAKLRALAQSAAPGDKT